MDYPTAYARKVLVNLALDGERRRTRDRAELGRSGTSQLVEHDQAITSMRRPVASISPPSWTWACVA
jgi:hypothetical protein